MAIGRRLKWVKEHDLAHGEFGKWLAYVKMNQSQARKFMTIAEKLNERSTSNVLGT